MTHAVKQLQTHTPEMNTFNRDRRRHAAVHGATIGITKRTAAVFTGTCTDKVGHMGNLHHQQSALARPWLFVLNDTDPAANLASSFNLKGHFLCTTRVSLLAGPAAHYNAAHLKGWLCSSQWLLARHEAAWPRVGEVGDFSHKICTSVHKTCMLKRTHAHLWRSHERNRALHLNLGASRGMAGSERYTQVWQWSLVATLGAREGGMATDLLVIHLSLAATFVHREGRWVKLLKI
ncbi:unnamed protein product, partial [Ectocarpus sp. 4 AP-2014]